MFSFSAHFLSDRGKIVDLLSELFYRETKLTIGETTLFRADSAATKAAVAYPHYMVSISNLIVMRYMKLISSKAHYLQTTLLPFIGILKLTIWFSQYFLLPLRNRDEKSKGI
jgi:hypothetical protein